MNTFLADFVICKVVRATDVPASIRWLESFEAIRIIPNVAALPRTCRDVLPSYRHMTKCRLQSRSATCIVIVTGKSMTEMLGKSEATSAPRNCALTNGRINLVPPGKVRDKGGR